MPPCRVHLGASLVVLLVASCGAGDRDADNANPEPALCPSIQELAPNFYRLLGEGAFEGLREVLEAEAGPPPGPTRLNLLLGVLLEVVHAVDVPGFRQVLLDALRSTSAGPLLPQLRGLLSYIDGRLGCPVGVACDHYELPEVLRRLFFTASCDADPVGFDARTKLVFLARALKHPRLPDLLDLFPRLLASPVFQGVLDSFRYEGCGAGPCEREDGFAALFDIVLDNVLVPGIPWDDILDLLRQVRLDTEEVRTLIAYAREMLDESPPSPEADLVGPLRSAIRCLRQVDPGRALGRNLYRILTLDEVRLEDFALGIDRVLDADPERLTLQVLAQALEYFRTRAIDSFRTLQLVAEVLLAPGNLRKIVPVLIAMIDADVVPELLDLLVVLTDGCATLKG
jgi:hypothetical protein